MLFNECRVVLKRIPAADYDYAYCNIFKRIGKKTLISAGTDIGTAVVCQLFSFCVYIYYDGVK
jgi:hypothetical protein